jgi:hypothetical protein
MHKGYSEPRLSPIRRAFPIKLNSLTKTIGKADPPAHFKPFLKLIFVRINFLATSLEIL